MKKTKLLKQTEAFKQGHNNSKVRTILTTSGILSGTQL